MAGAAETPERSGDEEVEGKGGAQAWNLLTKSPALQELQAALSLVPTCRLMWQFQRPSQRLWQRPR